MSQATTKEYLTLKLHVSYSYRPKIYCQTPVQSLKPRLGVDFVFPLSQQQLLVVIPTDFENRGEGGRGEGISLCVKFKTSRIQDAP